MWIPVSASWSSPFVRWQGPAADISSLDLALQVTRDGARPHRHRVAGNRARARNHRPAEGVVLRRADARGPARARAHERPDARAGVRDLGRVHQLGGGERPRRAPRRRDRPHEQRPAPRLPANRRARRDARLRELGARQLRPRSRHREGDARDRRARRGRGEDREGRARRPRRAPLRAVPRRARRRACVPARVDGPDRRRLQAKAGRDRRGLGDPADRPRGARRRSGRSRREASSATARRPIPPTAAPG